MDKQAIEAKLNEKLSPDFLEVYDDSGGCGFKFGVLVVSKLFNGKPLIERHRMVNESLTEEMKSIHALTIKTYTPEQWVLQKIK